MHVNTPLTIHIKDKSAIAQYMLTVCIRAAMHREEL
jgi:hypothetical protein